ncbi:MAG: SLBB domain-containing protein [Firmicutes bacterium]|nr:SLBB domain-containing protein [Bacillota bacterium]
MPEFRIVLKNAGKIDPCSISDYINAGGYQALKKALHKEPGELIEMIKSSQLRGRGGASFPTGIKMEATAASPGDLKYVVCNADEGEPGTFKDRVILGNDPHTVIEGIIISSYAVGASCAYLYLRAEYPHINNLLENAVKQAEENGFLGKNILGSGFSLDLKIFSGAGAYICGEETALMRSIEGKRGEPSAKPPYPTVKGLFGKPTFLSNVETLSNIPHIISNGIEWFTGIGTSKSKGTKIFSISGDVNKPCVAEVVMGTKLSYLINNLAGGVKEDTSIKAVQVGGPSGKCISGKDIDIPLSFESQLLGAGAIIVYNSKRCIVSVVKSFQEFFREESCGKCVPCREGVPQLLEFVDKISRGEGAGDVLFQMRRISEVMKITSLCGLGKTAPNSIIDTIEEFKEEYDAHLSGQCPAGICFNR